MRQVLDKKTDETTRKAWELNWQDISMKTIMEIFNYHRVKQHASILLQHLSRNGSILEAGCGLCPYLIYLKQKGYNVIGVDYNDAPLKKVLEFYSDMTLLTQDVSKLAFRDSSFSAYLSFGVIEHFTEGPDRALREASRVLKKGGIAIISVPQQSIFTKIMAPVNGLKKLAKIVLRRNNPSHYWEQYFNVEELKKRMEHHGLMVKQIYPIDHDRSLLAFGNFFRDKQSFDEMSPLAIRISERLKKMFPFLTCSAVMYVAEKRPPGRP